MFICPNCKKALVRNLSTNGVFWNCNECGGRAVGLGLLRKTIGNKRVTEAWALACHASANKGRPCPICSRTMVEIGLPMEGKELELELCRQCEFMWFDRNEYEDIPPPPLPPPKLRELGDIDENALSQAAREALALEKVRLLRESQMQEPDMEWKTLPAFFGLPVEMDSTPKNVTPWATYAVTLLISGASIWAFTDLRKAIHNFGLIPAEVWHDYGLTLITSFFLHGGVTHLVGNLYFLIIFGGHVEDYLGHWRWLLLLLVASILGDFSHIMADPASMVPCIGASGGISGLITFYALKFPYARLGIMFRFSYIHLRWIPLPAWSAFLIWMGFQFFGAYAQIKGFGTVSSFAHLGGVTAGVLFWLIWRNLDSSPSSNSELAKVTIC